MESIREPATPEDLPPIRGEERVVGNTKNQS